MQFKQWLNETGTSTGDIAGFSRITIPLVRRWWVSDWEEEQKTGKKRKKKTYMLPQVQENTQKKYSYSCVLFKLPSIEADKVLKWSKKNIPDDCLYFDEEDDYGREDEIHVTVLYGLHTDKPDEVKSIVSEIKPSNIYFREVSKFESEKYDVIKITVEGAVLQKMNKALKELPHTSNFPVYKPHCTLAYVKKGSCDHLLGKPMFDGWPLKVHSVVFSPPDKKKTSLDLNQG